MAKRGTQEMLLRQWRLVRALAATRRGRTPTQLATDLGASRSTLYRDLALLQRAGVPIATERVNGESRCHLLGERLPPLAPTARSVTTSTWMPSSRTP